jgi:hypothetical protein
MTNTVTPWGPWERAVLALLEANMPSLQDHPERVGGDLAYEREMPWYIRIDRVFSRSNRLEGVFTVDLEVFAPEYAVAESVSNDLEALLLGYPHVVEVDGEKFVFDSVSQNSGPNDLPWEDEEVTRLGATYVITARRR